MDNFRDKLQGLKETMTFSKNEEITNIIGADVQNEVQNRLFLWQFEKEDAKNLIDVYMRFSDKTINSKTLERLKEDLIREGRDIERKGIYPVEVILYTSKVINNRLKDVSLVETISQVLGEFLKKSDINASNTLEHIIRNWTWVEQLKIAISSLSFVNDYNLLSLIYNQYRSDKSLRYEVFKTLLNSKNDKCIDMILNIITYIDSDFEYDRRIGNLFKDKFSIYYPIEGLPKAQELYNSSASISRFGKKTLEKIVDIDIKAIDENEFELGKLVDLSKKAFYNNKNVFEKAFLAGGKNRHASIVAMSYSNDKYEAGEMLYSLYKDNKDSLSQDDLMNIVISLSLSHNNKALEICKENKDNMKFKPFEYASNFLLGNDLAAKALATELITGQYCDKNNITMKAVRPCLFKPPLAQNIEEEFSRLIKDCGERDLITYLINIKSFLRSRRSPGIMIELQKICGYSSKTENVYRIFKRSEKLQKTFMNLMIDLINADTISIYEKMMFSIANDNNLSNETRIKARNIVSELVDVAPPSV